MVNSTVPSYDVLLNSVGIIDGIEIFIEHPNNLETQKSSFSDYKSHTSTVKYLVAIDTFTGVFTLSLQIFQGSVVTGLPSQQKKLWNTKDSVIV